MQARGWRVSTKQVNLGEFFFFKARSDAKAMFLVFLPRTHLEFKFIMFSMAKAAEFPGSGVEK